MCSVTQARCKVVDVGTSLGVKLRCDLFQNVNYEEEESPTIGAPNTCASDLLSPLNTNLGIWDEMPVPQGSGVSVLDSAFRNVDQSIAVSLLDQVSRVTERTSLRKVQQHGLFASIVGTGFGRWQITVRSHTNPEDGPH